jgi:hypothetical protein
MPSALKSTFAERTKTAVDAGQWLQGMEELDYATCEASFEAKSGDEGRAGVGCRRSVFIISGGRIRNDQCASRGYADDE